MILYVATVSTLSLLASCALLWVVTHKKRRADARERKDTRLAALARAAVAYAAGVAAAGAKGDKLQAALSAFKLLDEQDGKRDFTDAQARIAIEAALTETKSAAMGMQSVAALPRVVK